MKHPTHWIKSTRKELYGFMKTLKHYRAWRSPAKVRSFVGQIFRFPSAVSAAAAVAAAATSAAAAGSK